MRNVGALVLFLFFLSRGVMGAEIAPSIEAWSDGYNVPGYYNSGQEVCDARKSYLDNAHGSPYVPALTFVPQAPPYPGSTYAGNCVSNPGTWAAQYWAHPSHGVYCPVGSNPNPNNQGSAPKYPVFPFNTVCEKIVCPVGEKFVAAASNGQGACWPVKDVYLDAQPPDACSKKSSNPPQGNPLYPIAGNKVQKEALNISLGHLSLAVAFNSAGAPWTHVGGDGTSVETGAFPKQPGEVSLWGDLGKLWWSNSHHRLVLSPNGLSIRVSRGQGQPSSFNLVAGNWRTTADVSDTFSNVGAGYRYRDQTALSLEEYSSAGLLQISQHAAGPKLQATYSTVNTAANIAPGAGYLLSLTDQFGRSIAFTYKPLGNGDVGISTFIDAAGKIIVTNYDLSGNLTSLKWQDDSVRSFVYDSPHANQAWALTGVTDELNKRYSTFKYAPAGWAKSTEHAGGTNKYEVTYVTPPMPSIREDIDFDEQVVWRYHEWKAPTGLTVSQPEGQVVAFNAAAVLGLAGQDAKGSPRSTGVSQPAGSGCGAAQSRIDHDPVTANITLRDDFNGTRVCHAYESTRNFETVRVEGLNGGISGTACNTALSVSDVSTLVPEARKITTEWHPDWRLETRRAEPGKITWWIYNGQPDPFNGGAVASCTSPMYGAGNVDPLPDGKPIAVLCKKVLQSTTDTTGSQGFAATLQVPDPNSPWSVSSRTVSHTYNQYGQVLTSTDERGQVTNYAYHTATTGTYTKGDLWKLTNALGHVTEYTQYNPHGQVLQAKDPNGIITSYTYDLRQRLTSVTQAGQLTQIDWWPTGLLKKVTQPDGSWLSYAYDDAHRLTGISDNLGNAVAYELDNAGNRKKEQVKAPSGALTLQINRNYDALNRLWKSSTGAPP